MDSKNINKINCCMFAMKRFLFHLIVYSKTSALDIKLVYRIYLFIEELYEFDIADRVSSVDFS